MTNSPHKRERPRAATAEEIQQMDFNIILVASRYRLSTASRIMAEFSARGSEQAARCYAAIARSL